MTVTVTNAGDPVEGADVEVGDDEYVTDGNGTVVAENVRVDDELDVEVENDHFEVGQEYAVQDGDRHLLTAEYEYEDLDDAAEDDDADEAEAEADDGEADDADGESDAGDDGDDAADDDAAANENQDADDDDDADDGDADDDDDADDGDADAEA